LAEVHDHDRAEPGDDITGEQRTFFFEEETEVVRGVSRSVERSERRTSDLDHFTVGDLAVDERWFVRESCDFGPQLFCKRRDAADVIDVAVRDEYQLHVSSVPGFARDTL